MTRRNGILVFLLFLFGSPFSPGFHGEGTSYFFEFLYLDSNVGLSSAGHNAIRFDETVYHFEHHRDKIFRLAREDWSSFHRDRAILENRSIHSARVRVDGKTYHKLKNRFNSYYVIQERQLSELNDIRNDIYILEVLTGVSTNHLYLPGAGYFADTGNSPVAMELKRRVEGDRGDGFLLAWKEKEMGKMDHSFALLHGDTREFMYTEGHYPPIEDHFSRYYIESLSSMVAIDNLLGGKGLENSALVFPGLEANDGVCEKDGASLFRWETADPFVLHEKEIEALRAFQEKQVETVRRLLESGRPDPGKAMLIAMARFQVLEESIRSGRLVFLDVLPENQARIPADSFCEFREHLPSLLGDYLRVVIQKKENLFARSEIREQDFFLLELAASRYQEVIRGLQTGTIRVALRPVVPPRQKAVDAIALDRTEKSRISELFYPLAKSYERERESLSVLRRIYGYDLTERNCSTELFRNINQALGDEPETIRKLLGGYVDPDGSTSFVPYLALQKARGQYRTVEEREYLSFRKAMLREMYKNETNAIAYAREASTPGSSLYSFNDRDPWFLFFTDDEIAPRPIYGLANLFAGLAQTIVGVGMIPWDGGDMAGRGLRGMFFSLPELVFVNIRKGSFPYVPDSLIREEVLIQDGKDARPISVDLETGE